MNAKITRENASKGAVDKIIHLYNKGQLAQTISLSKKHIKQFPNSIILLEILGAAYLGLNKHDDAVQIFQKLLRLQPGHSDAFNNLGIAFYDQGRFDAAVENYQKAVEIEPNFAVAHFNLGNAQMQMANFGKAIESYKASLQINPNDAEVLFQCGIALKGYGNFDQAIEFYTKVAQISPKWDGLRANIKDATKEKCEIYKLISDYARVLELQMLSAEVFCFTGKVLQARNYLGAAVDSYWQAIDISADYAEPHKLLGDLHHSTGYLDGALHSYTQLLKIKPDNAETHFLIGCIQQEMGSEEAATVSFRQALQIQPSFSEASFKIAAIYVRQGYVKRAQEIFEKILICDTPSSKANNYLFSGQRFDCMMRSGIISAMVFSNQFSNEEIYTRACSLWESFESTLLSEQPLHTNLLDQNRCLKIGFVSADFREHSIAKFVKSLISELKLYPDLQLYAYYNNTVEDTITHEFKQYFHQWNSVYHLSDEKLTCDVIKDKIDILVDLSNHTNMNRLGVFARKPAPLQVTAMGIHSTTGLSSIDYFFTQEDNHLNDSTYSECLVRLPASACFAPTSQMPVVNELPAIKNGFITFSSFNNTGRVSRDCISLWSELLLALPTSRLLFAALPSALAQSKYEKFFVEEGVDLNRIDFHQIADFNEYCLLHYQVDLHLMSFPYSGGTTICNGFWMGVPSLGLSEYNGVNGTGRLLLEACGLSDFFVKNKKDYFSKARLLADNLDNLSKIRANLRNNFSQSEFCKPEIAAASWYSALRIIWKRKCLNLEPEAFKLDMEDLECAVSISNV